MVRNEQEFIKMYRRNMWLFIVDNNLQNKLGRKQGTRWAPRMLTVDQKRYHAHHPRCKFSDN